MRAMRDFAEGKLKSQDHKDLLKYGIDPKEFSERFLKGRSEKAGGAGIGYYWEWADMEASNLMSQAIHRATKTPSFVVDYSMRHLQWTIRCSAAFSSSKAMY